MTEGHERQQAPETGAEDSETAEHVQTATTGTEDTNPAQGTQPIEGGGTPGQTQHPAPDDDVGVPDDVGGEEEEDDDN